MATNIKSNLAMEQTGNGVPTHISPLGTFYLDLDTSILYQNKNGVSGWVYFLDSTTPITPSSANTFTTGTTLVGNIVYFNRNDILSAYTVNLSSLVISGGSGFDVFVTGGTLSTNTATFTNNTGGTFTVTGFTTGSTANGTYTPTLTLVNNLTTATTYECQYLRVGNTVNVGGKVDVDPILVATSTQLGISLPIASDFGTNEDCGGSAFASGIAGQGAAIRGDVTNNRAELIYISSDVTNQSMYFNFIYQII